jgi:RHH-type rel operon transcriptional repressor/antitoxin RelB
MGRTTITVRLDSEKREALDAIAEVADRDRSYILNEAIDAYLDTHRWQVEHIRKGLRQARAGRLARDKEVKNALARWRR